MESACKEHGIRGHLSHEHIEQMIAEVPEDERQARVYGKFAHLTGLVFKKWDRRIHVIEPFEIKWSDYTVYEALDTHMRTPHAALWVAVNARGQKFVVDELFKNASEGELATMIKAKAEKFRVETRVIEPAADIRDQNIQSSLKQRLATKYNLLYSLGSKDRDSATKRLQEAFDYVKINDEFEKFPEWQVFNTCTRFIWEVERIQWDDWRGRTRYEKNPKEKPKDKDDHLLECAGRIAILEPEFIPAPTFDPMDSFIPEPNPDPFD